MPPQPLLIQLSAVATGLSDSEAQHEVSSGLASDAQHEVSTGLVSVEQHDVSTAGGASVEQQVLSVTFSVLSQHEPAAFQSWLLAVLPSLLA